MIRICRSLHSTILNRGAALVHIPWPAELFGAYGANDPRYSGDAAEAYASANIGVPQGAAITGVTPGRARRGKGSELIPCLVVTIEAAIGNPEGDIQAARQRIASRPLSTPTSALQIGPLRSAWFDGPQAS